MRGRRSVRTRTDEKFLHVAPSPRNGLFEPLHGTVLPLTLAVTHAELYLESGKVRTPSPSLTITALTPRRTLCRFSSGTSTPPSAPLSTLSLYARRRLSSRVTLSYVRSANQRALLLTDTRIDARQEDKQEREDASGHNRRPTTPHQLTSDGAQHVTPIARLQPITPCRATAPPRCSHCSSLGTAPACRTICITHLPCHPVLVALVVVYHLVSVAVLFRFESTQSHFPACSRRPLA